MAAPALAEAAGPVVRTGMFSIFDQAVVSGANFLSMWILVHACSQDEVGVYSLAFTVVLFLIAAQGNLVSVPYTVYCHRHGGQSLAEYSGSTLIHQLIVSLAAAACFLGLDVLLSSGVGPEGLRPAAWVLLVAIPFVLLREFARRAALAHFAVAAAIAIDVLVAVVQLAAMLVLWRLRLLSAAVAYAAVGAARRGLFLLVVAHFASRCGSHPAGSPPTGVTTGRSAGWGLLSQLTGLAFYIVPWLLCYVHGKAATGELMACTTLVGLSNLFVIGFNNFLIPKAARGVCPAGRPRAGPRPPQGDVLLGGRVGRIVAALPGDGRLAGRRGLRRRILGYRTADRHARPGHLHRRHRTDGQHGVVGAGPPRGHVRRRRGATGGHARRRGVAGGAV